MRGRSGLCLEVIWRRKVMMTEFWTFTVIFLVFLCAITLLAKLLAHRNKIILIWLFL